MLYIAHYAALRILLGLMLLVPARHRHAVDLALAAELSAAIADATNDLREQDVLTRIAYFESGVARDVARCSRRGDRGRSLGIFQVQPQTDAERRAACGSPAEQTALALDMIRRSAEACPGNAGADRLAMYVSGTCARGIREARHRWGADDETSR